MGKVNIKLGRYFMNFSINYMNKFVFLFVFKLRYYLRNRIIF